jgi:hypothetical protein
MGEIIILEKFGVVSVKLQGPKHNENKLEGSFVKLQHPGYFLLILNYLSTENGGIGPQSHGPGPQAPVYKVYGFIK